MTESHLYIILRSCIVHLFNEDIFDSFHKFRCSSRSPWASFAFSLYSLLLTSPPNCYPVGCFSRINSGEFFPDIFIRGSL